MKGKVFNIQRYSVNDGEGIRTSVFLKGCPLDCWWCHNPESKKGIRELVYYSSKCIGCGECISSCANGAVSLIDGKLVLNKNLCRMELNCERCCPTGAIEVVGREMTVQEVLAEVEKDRIFFEESKGGVTFSGGEPLMQPEFLKELLSVAQKRGLHTAVDTSGYAPWDIILDIAQYTDLFLYDIKLMRDDLHYKYTGVSNSIILDNLKKLAKIHNNIQVRVPLIPGINNDEQSITELCEFLQTEGIKKVSLLPYHSTGTDKYSRLGETYRLYGLAALSDIELQRALAMAKSFGLDAKIGG